MIKKKPFVITVACQKGGVGKTTCSIVLSTLLANRGYKVLGIDCDQQGNYTETLTGSPIRDLRLEGYVGLVYAINPQEDPKEYLWDDTESDIKLPKNLDVLIGDERTGYFSEKLIEFNIPDKNRALEAVINKFSDDGYDFVILDTAPALSPMLTNALIASQGVVAMYQPEKYCHSAMYSLFETITEVQAANPELRPLGILATLMDARRSDMKEFMVAITSDETLGKYCFNTIIKRSAATGRLAYAGVIKETNPEAPEGLSQFEPFVDELLERIENPDSIRAREVDLTVVDEVKAEYEAQLAQMKESLQGGLK